MMSRATATTPWGFDARAVPAEVDKCRLALCECLCENLAMATNLAIDPDLLERAVEVSGVKTKTAAVTLALKELVARREQARIVELFGSLDWDPDYDYKTERARD